MSEYKKTDTVEQGEASPSSTMKTYSAAEKREAAIAYLSQVEDLNRKIRLKKNKISIKRDALSLRSPIMSDMPHSPSPNLQAMETRICDVLTLEDDLRRLEARMAQLKAEMMLMIEKLENLDSQMVLVTAFLNLRSTGQACKDLHFNRSWYLKLKSAAVTEFESVLEREGELVRWIR